MGKKKASGDTEAVRRDPWTELKSSVDAFSGDVGLFKEIVAEQIKDTRHEDLVSAGEEMLVKLKEFIGLGSGFADTNVQPDQLYKMIESMTDLTDLMLPPKVLGGYCPCFKPKRSGGDYERRFYSTESKIIMTSFVCQVLVVSHAAEELNDESSDFSNISKKMNNVFNTLSEIKTQGNEKIREKAKNELAGACDTVNRFVNMYFVDTDPEQAEFKAEATRRILQTNELLMSRSHADGAPGTEATSAAAGGGASSPRGNNAAQLQQQHSRRLLVKAQSSLQEIMNSAAAICLGKAKAAQRKLDELDENLQGSYDRASQGLGALRKRMKEHSLGEQLKLHKDDMETAQADAAKKIEDGGKRWSTVAAQSKTRPVAYDSYDESDDLPERKQSGIGVADLKDPQKLMVKTGKTMVKVGTGGKAMVQDVLKTAVGIGQLIKEDLQSLTGGGSGGDSPPLSKKNTGGGRGGKGPGGAKRPG